MARGFPAVCPVRGFQASDVPAGRVADQSSGPKGLGSRDSGACRSVIPFHARRGTLLTSQVPVDHWHDVVGDPTFGDAILDRLLNNAHRITLKGASMRRLYDPTKSDSTT